MFPAVQAQIEAVRAAYAGRPDIAQTFARCYPNTLLTTVRSLPDGTTFVFTGDIPAMWLRDSCAQVSPYLPLAGHDPGLRALLAGLIERQARCVLEDPYANAFNAGPTGEGHTADRPGQSPWVWERKFELDSLCAPVRLLARYLRETGDAAVLTPAVRGALWAVVRTMRAEQRHDASPYRFTRPDPLLPTDTLGRDGRGSAVGYTGMVWSGFRPSDDACTYGYLIPANMLAVVALGDLADLARGPLADPALRAEAQALRAQIDAGIQRHGIVEHPTCGPVYAYEVDGLGTHLLMDDANVPSLLSMPHLGYRPASDAVYQNTRRFVLSEDNPHFFRGTHAAGIGSPHTPGRRVWPIALAMQGLTSTDPGERARLLDTLVSTTAGTGYMHEGFDPDDPARYTRPWFAWANSLFAEFVLSCVPDGVALGAAPSGRPPNP